MDTPRVLYHDNNRNFRSSWKKDKYDARDYIHPYKLAPLPDKVDLIDMLPPVRQQGNVGRCVGMSTSEAIATMAKELTIFTDIYSPDWIYNGARFIEGTLANDVGCYPKDAMEWLRGNGCLFEAYWPLDGLSMAAPSSEQMAKAIKYPGFAYYRVTNGVEGIKSALADKHPVVLGAWWFLKWENPDNGNLVEVTPLDYVMGGHATLLHGYDVSVNRFFGMNSWGTGWGKDGHYTMPFSAFDVFKTTGGYDAYYLVFDKTIPTPVPHTCRLLDFLRMVRQSW